MKKSISRLLICVMLTQVFMLALGSAAFAATPPQTAPSAYNGSAAGESETVYVDLNIYDITVPTDAAMGFYMDPTGLSTLSAGEKVNINDLVGGKIISKSAAKFINNSAKDVTVSVSLATADSGSATFIAKTGSGTGAAAEATNYTATKALVEANTNQNILLYAIPAGLNIGKAADPYVEFPTGYIMNDSAATVLNFNVKAAEYEAAKNSSGTGYTATIVANTSNGMGLRFGGFVNSKADWTSYTGSSATKLTVTATYTFTPSATPAIEPAATHTTAPWLDQSTAATNMLAIPEDTTIGFRNFSDGTMMATPKARTFSKAAISGNAYNMPFEFSGHTVASIKMSTGALLELTKDYTIGTMTIGTDDEAKVYDCITFTGERMLKWKNGVSASFTCVILLTNGYEYVITIS